MTLSCVRVVLILCLGMCHCSCKMEKEDTCVVPITPAIMITRRYIPSFVTDFFKKGHVFSSFLLDLFKYKSIFSV